MDALSVINSINSVFWVLGNVLIAYIGIVLLGFLVLYYIWFDVKATTGGKLLFRFMVSLLGIVFLVYLGVFVDPSSDTVWHQFPESTVEPWRPGLRLVIYGFVAFTISSLVTLLVLRKWFPQKVKKASDRNLVKVRKDIPVDTADY